MKLSYSVKLLANPGKVAQLDAVLAEYRRLVQERIEIYWAYSKPQFKSKYPPNETRRGGTLVNQAARKAWAMVKTTKKQKKGGKPVYRGQSLDLTLDQCKHNLNPTSTVFDGWIDAATLKSRCRVALPFNKYELFNKAEKLGVAAKSLTLVRRSKGWVAVFAFEIPDAQPQTNNRVGIDVGYSIAATTSTGKHYGEHLTQLQRRTKWRSYRSHNKKPYRQGLNRVAKQIAKDHPDTDFQLEQLNFKGKRKRTKKFRTRVSRWAYMHLSQRLDQLGKLEGFQVTYVDPAYTSQTCPKCKVRDSCSRRGFAFRCTSCEFSEHADIVGALNINGGEGRVYYDEPVVSNSDLLARGPQPRVPRELGSPDNESITLC